MKCDLLIIDDDELIHDLIKDTLAGSNYRIESAYDGSQGLRAWESFQPAVTLLDLEMPVMSGLDFLRQLKDEIQPGQEIVIVTGTGSDHLKVECFQLGARNFLRKPYSAVELQAIVKNCIDRAKENRILFTVAHLLKNPDVTPDEIRALAEWGKFSTNKK